MLRVVVTEPVHADAMRLLRDAGCAMVYGPDLPTAALDQEIDRAEAVILRVRRLDRAGPRLRIVSKHGTGVDNIDLSVMRAAGVTVTNTPGANAGSVAEHALMLMLALARDLAGLQTAARAGQSAGPLAGLDGRRLLVVGYGASGRRVAALGAALGMCVTVLSPRLSAPGPTPEGHAVAADLASALPQTDALSLHCPLTPQTAGLIGAAELGALPRGALVVNCARGGLIDEPALAEALASGHLGGAGLDVAAIEPLPQGHPLRSAPRLILTPHAAALGAGAFRAMGLRAAQNVLDHAAGRTDPACIVVPGNPRP